MFFTIVFAVAAGIILAYSILKFPRQFGFLLMIGILLGLIGATTFFLGNLVFQNSEKIGAVLGLVLIVSAFFVVLFGGVSYITISFQKISNVFNSKEYFVTTSDIFLFIFPPSLLVHIIVFDFLRKGNENTSFTNFQFGLLAANCFVIAYLILISRFKVKKLERMLLANFFSHLSDQVKKRQVDIVSATWPDRSKASAIDKSKLIDMLHNIDDGTIVQLEVRLNEQCADSG